VKRWTEAKERGAGAEKQQQADQVLQEGDFFLRARHGILANLSAGHHLVGLGEARVAYGGLIPGQ
jgi:hypothetical protein